MREALNKTIPIPRLHLLKSLNRLLSVCLATLVETKTCNSGTLPFIELNSNSHIQPRDATDIIAFNKKISTTHSLP